MAALRPYDPNSVLLVLGGVSIESGRGSGTFVSIEYNSPLYADPVVGVDGEVAIAKSNDNSARVTVTTLQDSPHHVALSALVNADKLAPNGLGGFPILIKTQNQVFEGEKAVIMQRPTFSFSNTIEEREWVFFCADLREVTIGPV